MHNPRWLASDKTYPYMEGDENLDRSSLKWKSVEGWRGLRKREEGSAILAEDYVELSPEQGRAPVTLNFSLDFLISR